MGGQLAVKQLASSARPDNRPQYVRMADILTERIGNGCYPVNSLLPTEAELCLEFSTSRHTVREALRLLTNAGLISRRQGSGSRVLCRSENAPYVHSVGNFSDVLREVSDTRFTANIVEDIDPCEFSCPFMKLPVMGNWLRITGVRSNVATNEPVCFSMMFVTADIRGLVEGAEPGADLCHTVSSALGDKVHEIKQEISVTPVPQEVATTVQLAAGDQVVQFLRRCTDTDENMLVGSADFYPVDRFAYRMRLLRNS